jgi:glycine/D-amino acid oxidase-like deaminating enzyme
MSDADTTSYGQSWYAATMVDAPRRSPLYVDLDVDVCVIGGGLAGLTVVRELARAGWSVVLLEARRIAGSASGRNTGFVLPGFAADAETLIERVGFERAKSLWALSQAGLDYVREAVAAAPAAAAVDPGEGWLYVSKTDNGDEFVRYVRLLGDLGCEIEGWPTERVRAVLRSERYFHAINFVRAITIHPLNYAQSLAAAAERDGARLFEGTPALSIDPAGVRKRIVTPSAKLRANHVVLCGNVQLGALMPRLAATLLPITTYVITTAPLGPQLSEAINYRGAVSDTDLADNHYRVVGGDRLMLSGRSTTWARNPRRYIRTLRADIRKTYPQLNDVAIDHAWAGTLGNTVHRMPQIGELGPGVWLASGFGGHGLNTTAMAGNLVARGIIAGDQTWREFTPFELVWAGGIAGRAYVQMRTLSKRLRDAIAERRAKARELAHLKAREAEAAREAAEAAREAEAARVAAETAAEVAAVAPASPPVEALEMPALEDAPSAPESTVLEPEPPELASSDPFARVDAAAREFAQGGIAAGEVPAASTEADADASAEAPAAAEPAPEAGIPRRRRRKHRREGTEV